MAHNPQQLEKIQQLLGETGVIEARFDTNVYRLEFEEDYTLTVFLGSHVLKQQSVGRLDQFEPGYLNLNSWRAVQKGN